MLLEELREAIAVEILQSYSDPQRLVNDMSQIVSWCGNLVVLDEEDGTVQFTHQTVKMFLLDTFRDQAFANFHFRQSEIDHYAGEICVTYLNFNDFKTKLIKQPKVLPLLTPEAILKASLTQGLNSKAMPIWEKVARFRERRRGYNPDSRPIFNVEALRKILGVAMELKRHHPFLLYASKYWLYHSATFEKTKTRTWPIWERLLLLEDGPAEIPWRYDEWLQRTRTISQWICNREHVALLSTIESSETRFAEADIQHMLKFSIQGQSLPLFDFILRESLISTRVLHESLMIAAGGGHLEACEKLLAATILVTRQDFYRLF